MLLGRDPSEMSLASSAASSFITNASRLSSRWERVPSLMPSGASPLVQMTGAGVRGGEEGL